MAGQANAKTVLAGSLRAWAAAVLFWLVVLAGVASAEAPSPATGRVYLVAVGPLSELSLTELVDYYRQRFQLVVESLSEIQLEGAVRDATRNQLIAEEVVALMKQQNPLAVEEPDAVIIGVTEQDMYIRGKPWRFAFSYRQGGRFAVVSSARMHLPSMREAVALSGAGDAAAFRSPNFDTRVKKVITKNIGMLHYRLPVSSNPRSVLYSGIMGIDELDEVGEAF